jgi:hypothetical protein
MNCALCHMRGKHRRGGLYPDGKGIPLCDECRAGVDEQARARPIMSGVLALAPPPAGATIN